MADETGASLAGERGGQLIELLREAQQRHGYVSEQEMRHLASRLGVSVSQVYGTATFYDQFRLNPPGRHSVRVCTGTACHVKGSSLVLAEWERELGICAGQTTLDGEFDLDEVACVGCCNLACAVVVDGEIAGEFKSAHVKETVRKLRFQDEMTLRAANAAGETAGAPAGNEAGEVSESGEAEEAPDGR